MRYPVSWPMLSQRARVGPRGPTVRLPPVRTLWVLRGTLPDPRGSREFPPPDPCGSGHGVPDATSKVAKAYAI